MSRSARDKIEILMISLGVMAFVSLGYFYSIGYRLDWVRYIEEPLYWRVENLSCPGKPVERVVVLSDEPDSKPKHTLRYNFQIARFLDTLPPAKQVAVSIRRLGYLWEFNYVAQQHVLAIESNDIDNNSRKSPEELMNCTYEPLPFKRSRPS